MVLLPIAIDDSPGSNLWKSTNLLLGQIWQLVGSTPIKIMSAWGRNMKRRTFSLFLKYRQQQALSLIGA